MSLQPMRAISQDDWEEIKKRSFIEIEALNAGGEKEKRKSVFLKEWTSSNSQKQAEIVFELQESLRQLNSTNKFELPQLQTKPGFYRRGR